MEMLEGGAKVSPQQSPGLQIQMARTASLIQIQIQIHHSTAPGYKHEGHEILESVLYTYTQTDGWIHIFHRAYLYEMKHFDKTSTKTTCIWFNCFVDAESGAGVWRMAGGSKKGVWRAVCRIYFLFSIFSS